MPAEQLPRLKDRRFVEVTGDNFDSVLDSMKPHMAFAVDNKLSEDPMLPSSRWTCNSRLWRISSRNRWRGR